MKVLVASGGSGGHIFPALSFLDALKQRRKDAEVLLVVNKRNTERYSLPREYNIIYISASSIKISLSPSNLLAIARLCKCAFQSISILLRFRPDIVVGFGGYPALFLVLFAHLLGIKTVIHEQNVLPGRANRFLSPFADTIAISFMQSRDYLKKYARKTVLTGNILRLDMTELAGSEAFDFFGFSKDKFTILVMGGSQGSRKINTEFLHCLSLLKEKVELQIIHLCGKEDFSRLNAEYKDIGVTARVFDFLKEIRYAYSISDLVISRAGATTISELIAFKIPAIVIPYPFAQQHQILNARVLSDRGAAILLEDKQLSAPILKDIIADLLKNRDKIKTMRSNYKNVYYPVVEQPFLEVVLSLLK